VVTTNAVVVYHTHMQNMPAQKKKIIVIIGPTASGKTGLSLDLAKKYNGEIISADSRQVYSGLDIGTEKITKEEMRGVPHHLIDVVDLDQIFTVQDFKEKGIKILNDIWKRNHLPFIVGGTGFYIDTLLYNIDIPKVTPNQKLRDKLEKMDEVQLFKLILEKDPERARTIDPQNKRRLVRALEIIDTLGFVPEINNKKLIYDALIIGIKTEDKIHHKRIEKRLKETIENGLLEEVRKLRENGISYERLNELGLEYRIASEHLKGEIEEEEMYQKMVHALRQYTKRQMTWFKRNKDIVWYTLEQKDEIDHQIKIFLQN